MPGTDPCLPHGQPRSISEIGPQDRADLGRHDFRRAMNAKMVSCVGMAKAGRISIATFVPVVWSTVHNPGCSLPETPGRAENRIGDGLPVIQVLVESS